MYSPWSELCPKFVQGMWARWTFSEQVWWDNRDPWALGSCFEFIHAGVIDHRVAEAHLRQAAQPHIGPKWTISRSEQYPEGPYMHSPWSDMCLRFAQRTWVMRAPFEQFWWSNRDPWALGSCFEFISFDFSCIDLWGPALFNIQIQDFMITHVICTPGHDISKESFQNKRLQFLVIFGMQGCFICRYFVSGPNPLQSF